MLYRIADVVLEMAPVGDMPARMKAYEITGGVPDITIEEADLRLSRWKVLADPDLRYYMETGRVFCDEILRFDGMMLHASAVMMDGFVYLFSGQSGMGKSTHAGMYLQSFGDRAAIINDDKPVLRRIQNTWYAYGTPWCGKDGINRNAKGRLAGICFLQRGDTMISRLTPKESASRILMQTQYYQTDREQAVRLLSIVDRLAREVPVFEFCNHAQPGDAAITYSAMNTVSEEYQT
jgi:hypothetical protein